MTAKAWLRGRERRLAVSIRIKVASSTRHERVQPRADGSRLVIPTDLMLAAWRQLFPAERMVVFGGRRTNRGIHLTSVSDVTEAKPTSVHVRAAPDRIAQTLIDLERTGAHLAVWMHSHPGQGAQATHPSTIDLNQHRDLQQHYSKMLVGIITVRDGWLRLWGPAVEHGLEVCWEGSGIEPHQGEANVFRLTLAQAT